MNDDTVGMILITLIWISIKRNGPMNDDMVGWVLGFGVHLPHLVWWWMRSKYTFTKYIISYLRWVESLPWYASRSPCTVAAASSSSSSPSFLDPSLPMQG